MITQKTDINYKDQINWFELSDNELETINAHLGNDEIEGEIFQIPYSGGFGYLKEIENYKIIRIGVKGLIFGVDCHGSDMVGVNIGDKVKVKGKVGSMIHQGRGQMRFNFDTIEKI